MFAQIDGDEPSSSVSGTAISMKPTSRPVAPEPRRRSHYARQASAIGACDFRGWRSQAHFVGRV
jgi:hypothetical protein